MNSTIKEKEWILSLPKGLKLKLLEDCIKEKEMGSYVRITKVLLDAPISKGGIATDEIDEIFKRHFDIK